MRFPLGLLVEKQYKLNICPSRGHHDLPLGSGEPSGATCRTVLPGHLGTLQPGLAGTALDLQSGPGNAMVWTLGKGCDKK